MPRSTSETGNAWNGSPLVFLGGLAAPTAATPAPSPSAVAWGWGGSLYTPRCPATILVYYTLVSALCWPASRRLGSGGSGMPICGLPCLLRCLRAVSIRDFWYIPRGTGWFDINASRGRQALPGLQPTITDILIGRSFQDFPPPPVSDFFFAFSGGTMTGPLREFMPLFAERSFEKIGRKYTGRRKVRQSGQVTQLSLMGLLPNQSIAHGIYLKGIWC